MNSFKLLILLASLFLLCNGETTYEYKCAKDLKADLCYAREYDEKTEVTTYYLKGCSKGKYCDRDEDSGYCRKYENKYLKEGKKCVINNECMSGLCKDEKCSYLSDGDECNNDRECGPKSYCNEVDKCAKLEVADKPCGTNYGTEDHPHYEKDDNDCVLGTLCGMTEGDSSYKCITMFSIDEGKYVSDPYLCKSGVTDEEYKCIARTSKSDEWDDYKKEYDKRKDKINDDDDIKVTDIDDRHTLDDRKVAKKFVEIDEDTYKKIDGSNDKDCVRDYFVSDLNGNRLNVSFISLLLLLSFFF